MPFDDRDFPAARGPDPDGAVRRRLVAGWLGVIAAMMLVMIVLGGATRLTGSGLSIMEWAPLSGALPPLSETEWQRLFGLYRTIPQYALVNADFGLDDFKRIFWLEWTHRLWGRGLGVAFLLPLAWFAWRGMLHRRMVARLAVLFVLGGLQGAVGWFMVMSGFAADSTAVSAYRLVAHLVLAVALYAAVLWTALSAWPARPRRAARRVTRSLAAVTACSAGLTIAAGGFVAGLHAGRDYNTFPLMDGHLVPPGYGAMSPWSRNLFENIAAVQFDHRLLATVTLVLALATVLTGLVGRPASRGATLALALLATAVLVQYVLGVATLLAVVPIGLAVPHQAMAMLLLTAALSCCHSLRAQAAA